MDNFAWVIMCFNADKKRRDIAIASAKKLAVGKTLQADQYYEDQLDAYIQSRECKSFTETMIQEIFQRALMDMTVNGNWYKWPPTLHPTRLATCAVLPT